MQSGRQRCSKQAFQGTLGMSFDAPVPSSIAMTPGARRHCQHRAVSLKLGVIRTLATCSAKSIAFYVALGVIP